MSNITTIALAHDEISEDALQNIAGGAHAPAVVSLPSPASLGLQPASTVVAMPSFAMPTFAVPASATLQHLASAVV